MAILKKDQDAVGVARKALEDAEADAVRAAKRAEAAAHKAEAFAAQAATIDPDADEKGFMKATRELAELRASADLHRSREANAQAKAEAARETLAAAVMEDKRSRLAKLDEEIRALDASAIEQARAFAATMHEEIAAVLATAQAADALDREIQGPTGHVRTRLGIRGVPFARGGAAAPGTVFRRLAQLETDGAL
jgi:hypothetical protein